MDYQKFLRQQEEERAYIEEQNRKQYEQQKMKRQMRERQIQEEHEQRMRDQQDMIRASSRQTANSQHDYIDGYSVSSHTAYPHRALPQQAPVAVVPSGRQSAGPVVRQSAGPAVDQYDDYFNSPY